MDTVLMAIYAIGGIAFLPLVASTVSGINKARRERRRAARMNRFHDRIGQ